METEININVKIFEKQNIRNLFVSGEPVVETMAGLTITGERSTEKIVNLSKDSYLQELTVI